MAPTEGYFEDDMLIPDYIVEKKLFPGADISEGSEIEDKKDLEGGTVIRAMPVASI
jgi:hypothetical protein